MNVSVNVTPESRAVELAAARVPTWLLVCHALSFFLIVKTAFHTVAIFGLGIIFWPVALVTDYGDLSLFANATAISYYVGIICCATSMRERRLFVHLAYAIASVVLWWASSVLFVAGDGNLDRFIWVTAVPSIVTVIPVAWRVARGFASLSRVDICFTTRNLFIGFILAAIVAATALQIDFSRLFSPAPVPPAPPPP